jgi:hypothetical protein
MNIERAVRVDRIVDRCFFGTRKANKARHAGFRRANYLGPIPRAAFPAPKFLKEFTFARR